MSPRHLMEQDTLFSEDVEPLGKALLQRVILPRPGEPLDVRTLYLEEATTNARRAHAPTRTSLSIGAESEASFCTYFNAFPASYWRRWSILTSVVLRLELSGHGRVDVYRSKADGSRIHVEGREFQDGDVAVEFEVELAPFEDGGWIWFDITSDTEVVLESAGWYAPMEAPGAGRVAVGIPTFNRPTDCVKALAALGSDPLVLGAIDAVIIPDQGTRKVRDEPGFAEAAAVLGDRLAIHDQANLGGSGGYSRVMYEALKTTDCEHILFMDDDIEIEPDSILRALALSRFAKTPTLVGGQMLNLQERSHLHTMGEAINRGIFMWSAAPNVEYDHDFSQYPLNDRENSKLLHRRIDVDFNGWWMCMIPRQVAEEIGQPLPLFIKWDDVEYGLRAREAGYPTVTMPGAAIWHMAWSDKDDAIDWQAYFHLRNRLVVAALHMPGNGRGLVVNTVKATLKHLLCLEYSTVAIQNKAIADFLQGPEHIFELLPTALGEVRAMREDFPDAVVLPSSTSLPLPSGAEVGAVGEPGNPLAKLVRLGKGLVHNVRPAHEQHHERPQLNVPTLDARWFLLSQVDGVTVTTADGRGVVYRKRDPRQAWGLLKEAMRLRRELATRFPELKRVYADAVPSLTSKERWESVFHYPA
ncbi:galactofuranosylgalactofuranosylrhamnosyl-N-acetylglucosaminyl-diphospho-decaprenol beta-1,5/1,6-galactofuranosyltransferase [Rhodococcus sp. OK611]|jgi:galactofuranosylgalactofuranosylrhamnosyl-N-acetylglucosaminyl-diphospho-decaprenol beta-1,5/1,6-galactofuranosyltransferase|uniref:glycosyltransferase n=1 Tax=unclassified Rhodococcus (in: high G+C Gram-positive bacteria) TaxID=192944 RepID=UPI000BD544E7|nr:MULTISPECIES: glycosyltransferase [unclassified Rhodococcus (in: high G+C Gram-positive bacteria)]PTR44826.1 galactofuranosylgalactofuranosylrhamnosyl-N-acetylglucosaminyl-diphospho-decaprenol beta-1,5/1,6-galactofuranosyltransferase [Rhodococcus sp. OK611]SNX93853.1 galactofuranosylgalactofuranosylrhamnosyl-N-acetylglucosaminyl-diphospho-decaprenol beta-1,5/1,6-galactofuranosyltransferase [Rhodococcus sp. OK270]